MRAVSGALATRIRPQTGSARIRLDSLAVAAFARRGDMFALLRSRPAAPAPTPAARDGLGRVASLVVRELGTAPGVEKHPCHDCGEVHWARQCSRPSRARAGHKCGQCGEVGHLEAQCALPDMRFRCQEAVE